MALLCLALVGVLGDTILNWGKIYAGVSVGSLDLSGLTVAEAAELIEETYGTRLSEAEIYVCGDETLMQTVDNELANAAETGDDANLQATLDEGKAYNLLWTATAETLSASLDVDSLVEQAFAVGRSDGGLAERISAFFNGRNFEVHASYDESTLENFLSTIDSAIGVPLVNYDITVSEGVASVTEGSDGDMVNRESFCLALDELFFDEGSAQQTMLASTEYTPVQITEAEAERICNIVNEALAETSVIACTHTEWQIDASTLGSWIITQAVKEDDSWRLAVGLDASAAKSSVMNNLTSNLSGSTITVNFEVSDDDSITVYADTDETIPAAEVGVLALEAALFADDADGVHSDGETSMSSDGSSDDESATNSTTVTGEASVSYTDEGQIYVQMSDVEVPDSMSFDEALSLGVITAISSYTTSYSVEPSSRQHNIHLAASLLNNSVVTADGGRWSFNDIAGERTADAGFEAASSIVNGEYVDSIGGGICQVATTVFNAVYESGFPVISRSNHSLVVSGYPVGRDAAVSYPYLDLIWENDSSSDVILKMTYTNTTVTATLYGVSPGYIVTSETGDWEVGEEYETEYIVDEDLAEGTSYVQTVGVNGSKITVTRTVTDASGTVLRVDTFVSSYSATNEVIVKGPDPVEDDSEETSTDGSSSSTENTTSEESSSTNDTSSEESSADNSS